MADNVRIDPASPSGGGGLATAAWIAGLAVLLLWSLTAWATALLLTGGGEFAASQAAAWAPFYPEVELALSTASAWLRQFGTAALWIVWGFGAVLIVFGTWLVAFCVRALQRGFDRLAPQASGAWASVRHRLESRAGAASSVAPPDASGPAGS